LRFTLLILSLSVFVLAAVARAQQHATAPTPEVKVVQGSLVAPGSEPFHLIAGIFDDPGEPATGTLEMHWRDSGHWRRQIQTREFSQTLIVNGDQVEEHNSADYFPLGLWSLATAIFDPTAIVTRLGPADQVRTKANGLSSESGVTCFDPDRKMCMGNPWGLDEFIGGAGHSIEFTDYHPFHGKRIARRLTYLVSPGDSMTAEVTELSELKQSDEALFAIAQHTDPAKRIRIETLSQDKLLGLAAEKPDIIWPQVLDGATTGQASFYISLDTAGKIREVLPLRTANERSNDSAIRQIMRWKFKPLIEDGVPVQAEGTLTFDLNTREYGPKDVLSDTEMRKLATRTAEPVLKPGAVSPGSIKKIWVAVDADGYIIEWIAGDGPSQMTMPIGDAMKQWQFKPLYEDGQPRPYRGQLEFHAN
jgi:hypothetical protein